jgi:nitroreductase
MKTATGTRLHQVVEYAIRAPSVHNTQPWQWRILDEDTLELIADRSRQLRVADPDGRDLMISCGAALHHATEAATALGLAPRTELWSDPADPDLLARIRFVKARPPADASARLLTLELRCTDRRRFTSWPVPEARLHELAESANGWNASAVPVTDVAARIRTELLMERAMMQQANDPDRIEEQNAWIGHSGLDGIPSVNAVPPASSRRTERPNRYVPEDGIPGSTRAIESSDGLIAICTAHDDQTSWLQAGETLSALWLQATRAGLSIVPLSQVIEMPETREMLHRDVFAATAFPQLLLRVGWQEIARTTLPRTPRRPAQDVILR